MNDTIRWSAAARLARGAAEGWAGVTLPTTVPVPEQLNAIITSVYDGDTIYADVHLTGHTWVRDQSVRLLGCNAAELKTPGGDAAKANLVTLLPVGTVIVLSDIGSDKYAPRWDAAVAWNLTPAVATDLVGYLCQQQWAAPWNGKGTKPVPPWPRTVP